MNMPRKAKQKEDSADDDKKFPLPVYDQEDDIYRRSKEVSDNPGEKLPRGKETAPGDDLDVPGAELDDADEMIGEEDEENNYYSLGGDDHNDLEEDNG
jgi:hypothetical protein